MLRLVSLLFIHMQSIVYNKTINVDLQMANVNLKGKLQV